MRCRRFGRIGRKTISKGNTFHCVFPTDDSWDGIEYINEFWFHSDERGVPYQIIEALQDRIKAMQLMVGRLEKFYAAKAKKN
jgi:hypothetical protein